jgi:hypothetical protein
VTVAVLANIRTDQGDSSMKSVRERVDMNAAYREVGSYRAAADICGTTPKTVKRAIKAAEQADAGVVPVRHNYDAVADLVADSVARTKGRITAMRLVAKQKATWQSDNHRGRRPGVWAPGDMIVFDWGQIGPHGVDRGVLLEEPWN